MSLPPILILRLVSAFFALWFLSGCYYLESEPVPAVSNYKIDLGELRRLARSVPGSLPIAVHKEQVAAPTLPGAFLMAGRSFDPVEMTHVVFQILSEDGRYTLIDSAQNLEMHEAMPGDAPFDEAAWDSILRAMDGADLILITHEHPDHLGGVARHPRGTAIAAQIRLTSEQLANEAELDAIDFPPALREKLVPLEYDRVAAVAPGIVVQKAAGHTPGSQLVFVVLADGQELLFVGDAVWNRDALTDLTYRPRFMTDWLIGEDREAGIHILRALADLLDSGEVDLVVSHDARTHIDFETGFRQRAH